MPHRDRGDGQKARYVRVTATRLWQRTNDYVFALAELQVDSGRQERRARRGGDGARLDRGAAAGAGGTSSMASTAGSRLPDLADAGAGDGIAPSADLRQQIRDAEAVAPLAETQIARPT